jgi:hypothetical protein
MPLQGYGVLYGTVETVREPRAGETHWLLIVQPLDPKHPPYRVGLELWHPPGHPIGIEGQWCNLTKGNPNAKSTAQAMLSEHAPGAGPSNFFTVADGQKPGLDYVRSGILPSDASGPQVAAFQATANTNDNPVVAGFKKLVVPGARVVICGTGTPSAPFMEHTGFTGVSNVHMNQGTRAWIRNKGRHDENGPNQDGALFVLVGNTVHGLFLKYANQTLNTDANGEPQDVGVQSVDQSRKANGALLAGYAVAQAQEIAHNAKRAAAAAAARNAGSATAAAGFAFAEEPGSKFDDPFVADDDHLVRNNPVAQAFAKGQSKAPEYIRGGTKSLVMQLADVRGQLFVDTLVDEIAFDFIGDTGATSATEFARESKVTDQLCALAKASPPAFCFHVGDVVYFYGESDYFPCQFSVPFKHYPAPIFAIPGNHDACIYDDKHKPLEAFIEVFCAEKPTSLGLLGGASRTTMTQPGTYFTLDAPHVSIIGLFSGAAESLRYMSKNQLAHFADELARLSALRAAGDRRAIILAVHHLPQFYAARPDAMSKGLDSACAAAGLWPDAVVVGHAHLYQRFIRTVNVNGKDKPIPYIVCGNGGYKISPGQDAKVDGKPGVSDNLVVKKLGFVRATCDGVNLTFKAIDIDGETIDTVSA